MQSSRRASARSTVRPARRWLVVAAVLTVLTATELTALASGASGAATARSRHNPIGHLGVVRQGAEGVYVRGWAYDADTKAPAKVRIMVDGKRVKTVAASLYRPDLVARHPSIGKHRGFHLMGPISDGTHTVCAYAINYPTTHRVRLGCRTATFHLDPFGVIASVTQQPGHLTATGWAIDPNAPTSARPVVVRVDGKAVVRSTANRPYRGLAKVQPSAGANHGYSMSFPITEGSHQICVRATNIGLGVSRNIQCTTRTVNFSPTGAVSRIQQMPGGFRVNGYASDPDTTATTSVQISADGKVLGTTPANRTLGKKPGYGYAARYTLPGTNIAPGNHTICAIGINLGAYGKNRTVQCRTQSFNYNPVSGVDKLSQLSPGAAVTAWATDPDTNDPIKARIFVDHKYVKTITADAAGGSHPGHMFTTTLPLADGTHLVCVVGMNALYGSGNSAHVCKTVKLAFEPYGGLESVARAAGSSDVIATGWAIDPDTTGAVPVQMTIDGGAPITGTANISRPDIAKLHPGTGTKHGYAVRAAAADGEHTVCLRAMNVLGGSGSTALGCKILNAVHPVAPKSPTAVGAIAGYGGARIVWNAPTSDGGAPWSGYTITASPGGTKMTVGPSIQTATLLGLKPSTKYTFSVVATNVAGKSVAGTSPAVTTEKEPPAQTSPAPISTSRYIRNITGGSSADLAKLRKEGAADAKANPSGHGYLSVLAVGGQDESRQGVLLSATIRFVAYTDIVKNLNAYVDGYSSQQRPSAPVTVAIATNNDIDVTRSSGGSFANKVIDPVQSHADRYPGITIAGSDDIEPGFRAGYTATNSWLQGYLSATRSPFVFTGSADGCAWTVTNRGCNNGWTMRDMYHVAGGAAPIRIINLPQIYNTTMAQQWRYISLTGVQANQPKINFGGALTEYTACKQAHSCGSLTAPSAWRSMWGQLNAEPKLKLKSLPYSTDLRIDS
jgi:Fibronectin type III domain